MSDLKPTLCIGSVAELQPDLLLGQVPGLSAITFDLDKTLTGQHEWSIPYVNIEALIAIDALGLRIGIISNANSRSRTSRVHILADTASGYLDEPIEVVTSLEVGGKKKPLRQPFDKMAEKLAIRNNEMCHVGDQLLKDVLGANRADCGGSVLVRPFGRGDDPRVKYLQRPIEAAIRPLLGLPFLVKNF